MGPEDRIRDLCTLLLAAQNDEAIRRLILKFRDALHELKSATEHLPATTRQPIDRGEHFHARKSEILIARHR